MRRRAFLGAIVIAALSAGDARADEVADTLAEIGKARAGIKTLIAPFTQVATIGLLAQEVKTDGEMTLVRADQRLRWEQKPPDAITYWIGPGGLTYATPSGSGSVGKAGAGKLGAVLDDLMTLIGGDLAKLRARYDLAVKKDAAGVTLTAQPRTEDVKKSVKSLELAIAPDLWTIKRVVIEQPGDSRSVITFTKVTRDAKVDPAKMTPPPPKKP